MSQSIPNAKPWQSHTETLVDNALRSAISDPESIRQIRPNHPHQLFAPREGYAKQTLGIMDVLNIDRYTASNRSWVSGAPVMFRDGTFMEENFSSSSRYSMQSLG
ncbi:hypothetical protein UFOVP1130_39 [uncultured Caudovirales phage]|uniref:Uncharacterized protein n=1 Tax=uncultured Caudovirales phage TaxID=2100421 RepID=A0A6J5QLV0_9CAUD|nr:hypothetical protein UFOVP1130_39 [uncultured Caudovirales phage]